MTTPNIDSCFQRRTTRQKLFEELSELRRLAAEADTAYQLGRFITEKSSLHEDDEKAQVLEAAVYAYDQAVQPDLLVKLLDEVLLDMVVGDGD
jgi:hypothetical protein